MAQPPPSPQTKEHLNSTMPTATLIRRATWRCGLNVISNISRRCRAQFDARSSSNHRVNDSIIPKMQGPKKKAGRHENPSRMSRRQTRATECMHVVCCIRSIFFFTFQQQTDKADPPEPSKRRKGKKSRWESSLGFKFKKTVSHSLPSL